MQLRKLLEQWDLNSLKITAGFLEMEWVPRDEDKAAAWELYVELLTRVATQDLDPSHGHEKTALESIYHLFPLTREILKRNGRNCINFSKIAVVVLNQVVRPFTAKWHVEFNGDSPLPPEKAKVFRQELQELQDSLRKYARLLADLAGVEDLTRLEG
ncbi:MAG: hypothetical protein WBD07_03305 [Vicinamibacterales bacterium]